MSKEVTNQDILRAITEVANELKETKIELKGDISRVEKKVDLVDTQLNILAGELSKTRAEVKILQDAE